MLITVLLQSCDRAQNVNYISLELETVKELLREL